MNMGGLVNVLEEYTNYCCCGCFTSSGSFDCFSLAADTGNKGLALSATNAAGRVVENGYQALEIAQNYVSEKYQQNFSDYSIILKLDDNTWAVSYAPPGEGRQALPKVIADAMRGGGPRVEIHKETGVVVWCFWEE